MCGGKKIGLTKFFCQFLSNRLDFYVKFRNITNLLLENLKKKHDVITCIQRIFFLNADI